MKRPAKKRSVRKGGQLTKTSQALKVAALVVMAANGLVSLIEKVLDVIGKGRSFGWW
jgi:hypothetical protein